MITIKFEDKQINAVKQALKAFPDESKGATATILNKTTKGAITDIKRHVKSTYNFPIEELISSKIMKTNFASKSNLSASIVFRSKRLTLYRFVLSPTQPAPGTRYKVKVAVRKGTAKEINTQHNPFIAKVNGTKKTDNGPVANYQIVKRAGVARKPIFVLHTLSPSQMIANGKDKIQSSIAKRLEKNAERELNYRIGKIVKRFGGN